VATIKLPILKMNNKRYFVNERLKQLRNVENPHDMIPMDEAFVRIRVSASYIVPNDPEMIQEARSALYEDIMNAYKYDEVEDWINTEPAPDGKLEQVPEFILGSLDDEEDTIDDE